VHPENIPNNHALYRKIFIGFLLGAFAVGIPFLITHITFEHVNERVSELSDPNEKLKKLNTIFEVIITLDQKQRADIIQKPQRSFRFYDEENQHVSKMIDSLLYLSWDSVQHDRLLIMKEILQERSKLFAGYLNVRSSLINQNIQLKIDTLAENLQEVARDTSIVTTQKTTTTIYRDTLAEVDDRSFFGKLFGRKKTTTQPIKVQEETISIDTVSYSQTSTTIEDIEQLIHQFEEQQKQQSQQVQYYELRLIRSNGLLISKLISILQEVETEEFLRSQTITSDVHTTFNDTIKTITFTLIIFFLTGALLVYLIWLDITKSNYYKKELEHARDEAQALTGIKQRFLANMSHEIRTPLQSIIGFSEQLKHNPDNKDAINSIYNASEHLLQIVNEVLDYSKINAGNIVLNPRPFHLYDVIEDVVGAMRVQAEAKGLKLEVEVEFAEDICLRGDDFRIRQILFNLLGNAIKFTKEGYVTLKIFTDKLPSSEYKLRFIVQDTGIGIETENLSKIFNQFEQLNQSTTHPLSGTGLGLSIVKAIIEVMKGQIEVDSEVGKGTTFDLWITLPLSAQESKTTDESSEFTIPDDTYVWIIDDDKMILQLCSHILSQKKIKHKTFHQSHALLDEPKDDTLTHVFMDIRMPEIDGIELRKLLHERYKDQVRYIALTAHVFPEKIHELLTEGFDNALTKPFREVELLQAIGVPITPENDTSSVDIHDPIIQYDTIQRMTMGDKTLLHEVMEQFLEDTTEDVHLLQEATAKINWEAIREIAHRLSGRTGQLGAYAISKKLMSLERTIVRNEMTDDTQTYTNTILKELEALIAYVKTNPPY
jgi:signal transduction histidine kinase/FixJ family two-component response regulator